MNCDEFYEDIFRENKMQQNLGLRSFPSIWKFYLIDLELAMFG